MRNRVEITLDKPSVKKRMSGVKRAEPRLLGCTSPRQKISGAATTVSVEFCQPFGMVVRLPLPNKDMDELLRLQQAGQSLSHCTIPSVSRSTECRVISSAFRLSHMPLLLRSSDLSGSLYCALENHFSVSLYCLDFVISVLAEREHHTGVS